MKTILPPTLVLFILLGCGSKKDDSKSMTFDSTRVIKMTEPISKQEKPKELLCISIDSLSQLSVDRESVADIKTLKEEYLSGLDSAKGMIAIESHKDVSVGVLVELMEAIKESGLKAYLKTRHKL